ncbi:dihydroorotase [bacterium]|nr:dihydroorotase [bacterium]
MIESILFQDIEIISGSSIKQADVLVKNGKIAEIGWDLPEHAEEIIREPGLILMPGVIDPHVHFRDPGLEWKEDLESGSKAAAAGGVTTFFDMPNTNPPATTAQRIEEKKRIAAKKSIVNYNFFIGATLDNLDELVSVQNVPGIKIFVGSSTGNMLVDDQAVLESIFKAGGRLIAVHSEDEAMVQANKQKYAESTDPADHLKIRCDEAAVKCTKRLVGLARQFQRRLHICHLTTADEADFLERAGLDGLVTTEVSPQHLLMWAPDIYDKLGTLAQINPPIRTKRHADGLWRGLKNGTISCIATDHAPHTLEEKRQPFGKAHSGMPGVETSLPLMLTLVAQGRCSIKDICRWMSEGPATVFGISGKGKIEVGFDADLILVDLKARGVIRNSTVVSKCGWTAFDGYKYQGAPIATFVNGQMVYREGDFFMSVKGKEAKLLPPWER